MADEIYSVSADFTSGLALGQFHNEILAESAITSTLIGVDLAGDVVTVIFVTALTGPEKTALDAVVAAHVPNPALQPRDAFVNISGDSMSGPLNVPIVSGTTISGASIFDSENRVITDVNSQLGPSVTLTTSNIGEGSNLYYTEGRVDANATVVQNTADILTNSGISATNQTGVSDNTADILTNSGISATNAGNISTNATDISNNTADILTNSGISATNIIDIAQNVSDITNVSGTAFTAIQDGTNLGTGDNIFSAKNGTDLEFRTVSGVGNVAVTIEGDVVVFSGTGDGNGDVIGPAGATDNAVVLYDSTTGKLIKDSSVIITGGDTLNADTISGTTISGNSVIINTLDGVLFGTSGLVSGSATTTELPEGSNLYYTEARVNANATVVQNTADILTNSGISANNIVDIAQNTADILTNSGVSAANIANISTNTTDIATNTADILTNSGISANNIVDIAQNVSDITNVSGTAFSAVQNGASLGNGDDIFSSKNGTNLEFRTVSGVGNVAVTIEGDVVVFSGTGAGDGDVVGPVSATDNAVVVYDGTTGKLIKDSSILIINSTLNAAVLSGTTISGNTLLVGNGNISSGLFSFSQGLNSEATGNYSSARGLNTSGAGFAAHAEGSSTLAMGSRAHAEGDLTEAHGQSSHTEGTNTYVDASAIAGHSEGQNNRVSGASGHAEGSSTWAIGQAGAHAEGQQTEAIGNVSHAEGSQTKAVGAISHAQGNLTISSGLASHAGGISSRTGENALFAFGNRAIANASGSFVLADGRLIEVTNDTDNSILFGFENGVVLSSDTELTLGALDGVLFGTSGLVSGSATTTELPEGTNLYYTEARVDANGSVVQNTADILTNSGISATNIVDIAQNTTDITNVSGTAFTAVQNGTNLGGGDDIFSAKNGTNLEFKTVSGVGNVSITTDANVVTFSGVSGVSGELISFDVNQTSHGFSGLSTIYHDGNKFLAAQADDEFKLGLWIVSDVADGNNFTAAQAGRFTSAGHGLVSGCYYFTSPTISGVITNVAPSGDGQFSNPLLFVEDDNTVHALPFRPSEAKGSAGESEEETASNLGDGIGVFDNKVGTDFQFNSVSGLGNVVATLEGNEVHVSGNTTTINVENLVPPASGAGTVGTSGTPFGLIAAETLATYMLNLNGVDVTALIDNASPMGLITGGILNTSGTGLDIGVSAGFGFVMHQTFPNHELKKIVWDVESITVASGQSNYIFFNSSNVLSASQTRPFLTSTVLLGRVTTSSTGVGLNEVIPMDAHHMANKLDRTLREGVGPIYDTGSIVTTPSGLFIDITAGKYFFAENQFTPSGGSLITFLAHFQNASGNFVRGVGAPTDEFDEDQYDDGTGLVAMSGSHYGKHSLYTIGDNSDEKYLSVYPQAQFATLLDAQESDLPNAPSWFEESITLIAGIITQQGNSDIVELIDSRPIIGFRAPAASAASTHGNLLGLTADDHPQYVLSAGDSMTGNLTMNGGADILTAASGTNELGADGTPFAMAHIDEIHALTVSGTRFIGDVFDVNYVINGNGSVIASGSVGDLEIPYDCAPLSWTIINEQSGTISVDVRRTTFADYSGEPDSTASIVGTEKPLINAGDGGFKNQDTVLSSWSGISAGDWLNFHVDENPTLTTRATVAIKMRKLS